MDGGRERITPMSNIPQQRSGGVKKKERKNWDQIKSWKLDKERAKYDTESQEKHEKQKG